MAKSNKKGKMPDDKPVPEGYKEVFSAYITLKNGKRIYPKSGKAFRFFVKIKK